MLCEVPGSFPHDVHDGVDGLLVPLETSRDRQALRHLADRAEVDRLMAAAPGGQPLGPLGGLCGAIEAFAADGLVAVVEAGDDAGADAAGRPYADRSSRWRPGVAGRVIDGVRGLPPRRVPGRPGAGGTRRRSGGDGYPRRVTRTRRGARAFAWGREGSRSRRGRRWRTRGRASRPR